MARHGRGRPAAAGALMLLAFCAAPLGSRAFGIPGAKFFSLVPSAQLREGQGAPGGRGDLRMAALDGGGLY